MNKQDSLKIPDEKWMALAFEQALLAQKLGEVPVGAILIHEGQLIASAHNQPISSNDPTAHAEMQLLRKAGATLNTLTICKVLARATNACFFIISTKYHLRYTRMNHRP
jgi:tRNA(adenine34) deaminase